MEQGRHTAPLYAIHDIGQLHRGLIKEQQMKSSRLMYCTVQEGNDECINQSPNVFNFKKPKNRFQGTNSSLAGRNDNPIPTRFLAPQILFTNFSTVLAKNVIETGLNIGDVIVTILPSCQNHGLKKTQIIQGIPHSTLSDKAFPSKLYSLYSLLSN
jgi:hypothetical protein